MREIGTADFLNWLERHDPEQTYNFQSQDNCLIFQYMREFGYEPMFIGYNETIGKIYGQAYSHTAENEVIAAEPQTFGAVYLRTMGWVSRNNVLLHQF